MSESSALNALEEVIIAEFPAAYVFLELLLRSQ